MSEIPIYSKQDCAFNSLNKEFRNTRFQNSPMNIRIHNPKYSGNGMKGIYEHDTSNVNNLGGAVFLTRGASLNRKSKEPKVIEMKPGVYHGYKALEPGSILLYYLTEKYNPGDEFRVPVGHFGEEWTAENK